ncbi:MAG: hypothetical protein NDJ92_13065 [Thermoanaerobaculia bacterium]|nr:hypothetical protein [Thermoanaerobaculia bacterium]
MTDATPRSLDADCVADSLTRTRVVMLVLATTAFAALRVWGRARSAWDWDESLFALALRDFDVVRHNPHPPGFPLYVAAARVVALLVPGEFESLRAVNLLAGALLFPVAFFTGRATGFGFTTSFAGAALLCAAPNVLLFGAGAFSDVPSLVLSLAAVTLLLRGRSNSVAFLLGMTLAGAASSIRIQNLLICALPFLLALPPRWRASRRAVIAGAVLAAVIVATSYGAAAIATGSWAGYADAIRSHADYIARTDSWRGPDRAPLPEVAELVFVRPFRAASLPGILSALALLALVDLAVHRHRPTALVAGMFLPMMIFGLLMLDWHSMPRFAVAWMPFHAILAARGAAILATMIRSWLRTPVTEVQWLLVAPLAFAMVQRTMPALEIMRNDDSPPVAAMREVARTRDPATARVWTTEGSTAAMARLELPGFDIASVRRIEDVPLAREGRDAILVAEGNLYGAENVFRRARKPFLGVERERFFEVSIVPVASMVQFGEGWHDPDEIIAPAVRWMGTESRMAVGASGRDRIATLHLRLPRETAGLANVEIARDGVVVAQLEPVEMVFDVDVPLAASNTPHEISIRVDRTFRPSESEPGSTDERDLGLRLLGLDLR